MHKILESGLTYFNFLYDSIRFPIQVIDDQGKVVYVNEAFSLQWGYSLSELSDYSILNDPEVKRTGIQDIIFDTFRTHSYSTISNYADSLLRGKEETVPLFRTNIFFVSFTDKNYVVLLHEDQTERVLTEQEIKKARDANKESERLKDTFLNVLSHELRTPLNIILGYSSLIRENLKDKMSAEDNIYLENLQSGSERLFKSITQMLEFAQIEAGTYSLQFETLDLITVFQDSITTFKKQASEKQIDIKTNFSEKSIFVDVDLHCIENSMNILLSNAVKFTQQGFIEIETRVLEDKELAICKIKDSGIGISTEYLDHLFQPFSQEDLKIGRPYEGNGLGLALAKRYIEKMGGSLLVDSIKGVGSTFTFTLPLSQKAAKSKIKQTFDPGIYQNKILMLDDTGESYGLVKAFLKNEYEISLHDIRSFKLDYLSTKNYAIIIFDVSKNFWEQAILICKDIKKNDHLKRPIIIISSEFLEDRIERFYEAGADKFLIKPFTKENILSALEEVTHT